MNNKGTLSSQPLSSTLFPYPVNMAIILNAEHLEPDIAGKTSQHDEMNDCPTVMAQYALLEWNHYLATENETHARTFLSQAKWLIEHEARIGKDAGGWPTHVHHPLSQTHGPWLSSLTQGIGLSVLVRAYQLTYHEVFREAAHRIVRTFERDILDGGVCTPLGKDGIFFEEVAVYPAAHVLTGCIFALLGLHDYFQLTADPALHILIQRSLRTLQAHLCEFDVGFWTRSHLLHRHLSSPAHLTLQIALLQALATTFNCDYYLIIAANWQKYQERLDTRVRYWLANGIASIQRTIGQRLQRTLFPASQQTLEHQHVCISVPAFPVSGGVLTFLNTMTGIMKEEWQCDYLTQFVGPKPEKYIIHRFGTRRVTPWYFPFVWLYILTGFKKILWLGLHGTRYSVMLPQDSIYTGAFTALAAKIVGARTVCIDHGDMSLLIARNHQLYRNQRISEIASKPWPWPVRSIARHLLTFYWPSRLLLARIAAHFIDHYLIPGVSEDGVDEICSQLAIPSYRITRFASVIELEHHTIPEAQIQARLRKKYGIAEDAIVLAIVCRLAPEKGLEIAIEAISQALNALSDQPIPQLQIIIVGDGPLREQLEKDIQRKGWADLCIFRGEVPTAEAIEILGISDIFLYTSRRGACYSLAVLEAMASRCAVIASTEPIANAFLLANGRGIAVPPGDAAQISKALIELIVDRERRLSMGNEARNYIATYHHPDVFKRTLLRATFWSALDTFMNTEREDDFVCE